MKETVTYYKAAKTPIKVGSNKTILGIGNKGIIKGKGLSFAGKNVIVQNIQVSDLNHKYVWGGDALSFAGADLIWIDHVTVGVPSISRFISADVKPDRSPRQTTLCFRIYTQHSHHPVQQLHQRCL